MQTHQSIEPLLPQLRAVTRAIVSQPADVDDAVQEAALRAHRHADQLADPRRFGAWAKQIGRNCALTARRRQDRQVPSPPEHFDTLQRSTDGWDALQQAETKRRVHATLEQVPETIRGALIRRDLLGASYQEIADELGISLSAAKMRVARGRTMFRNCYVQ